MAPADSRVDAARAEALLLGVAVVAVSTSAPLVRLSEAPTLVVAFWRNALACAVIVPLVVLRHRAELRRTSRRERRLMVVAGALLAAHFATWIPSLSFTSVASSVALVCTQPVWAALIARARGELVAPRAWLGTGLALAGVLLLAGIDVSLSGRALLGDALALAGGALAAAYVTVGAEVRRTVSTTAYTGVCYAAAALGLLAVCAIGRQPVTDQPARAWLCIAALTVGPQLLGHSLVNRVLRTFSPTAVSVAILLEVVGATLLAWWWFGETPAAGLYPATALVVAGVLVVVRAERPPLSPPV